MLPPQDFWSSTAAQGLPVAMCRSMAPASPPICMSTCSNGVVPPEPGLTSFFPADPGVGLPDDSRLRRRHMALREGSPACRPNGEPHVVRRAGRVDCFVCGAGQFQGTLDRNHLRAITISTATDSPTRYRPRKFASRGALHRARTGLRRAALDLLAHHQSVPPV